MDDDEKDEVPMLLGTNSQLSDRRASVELRRFTARSQSASMFTPPDSIESYESQNQFLAHTSSLSSTRRTPFVPLSGPLYPAGKTENNIWPTLGITSRTTIKPMRLDFPSVDASDKMYLPNGQVSGGNVHLTRSGLLGTCNDPYCTTCPTSNNLKASQRKNAKYTPRFNSRFQSVFSGDYKAKGWTKRSFSFVHSCIPIMNPHAKVVQQWNQFFVLSCLVAIFIDPTFFLLFRVIKARKCIVLEWRMATVFAVLRSITDFIYFLHILLQFRLAYVAPESTVVGAGDLVDHPKKIAKYYLRGYFIIDLFVVLPLPQIMILVVLRTPVGLSANYARTYLQTIVLIQYLPRILRCLPLLVGQSASGFIFEPAWANFFINILIFILSGHVVGSCWYLFGIQRVNHCIRATCSPKHCEFIDCGISSSIKDFSSHKNWEGWLNDANSTNCFENGDSFDFGIYQQVVKVANNHNVFSRYTYSLFWGFQQICTLAGNQVPSEDGPEALFVMGIIGLGLFLFALLIGNMQNFLLALGRRRSEMQLRHRDVEQWMSHRRLPDFLRRQVRQSERYAWSATRGVNEEALLENLPEDLQVEIRRHLFNFIKRIRIFAVVDDPIFDAICEKLRQKTYIKGSRIIYHGGLVDKMYFIVRGKLESLGADGNSASLLEGNVCGEELLTLWLEHTLPIKDWRKTLTHGQRLISNRTVTCLTNVEAFSLKAADLEEVNILFARFLHNPLVQGAIRYESPYWRGDAVRRIQAAWRSRNKRLNRTGKSQ